MSEVLLAIDTSTPAGSVSLSKGETLQGEIFYDLGNTHTDLLLQNIQQLLDNTGLSLAEVDVFGVVLGPGSFTGLRVGLATVKGLALAMGKPVVGTTSLRALAAHFPFSPFTVCAMIDARKKEIYAQLFRCEKGVPVSQTEAMAVPPDSFLATLEEPCVFVGNGALAYRMLIAKMMGDKAHFAPWTFSAPKSSAAASLLLDNFRSGKTISLEELAPYYIRLSEAEILWAKRQQMPDIEG